MQFSDLPFPVTFVAPDGWAHNAKRPEDMREWSATAIQKYSRIGFIIADSNGSAWRLTRIDPERKITLLDRLRGIFQHRKFAVRITVEAAEGDPLTVFRECFRKALEGDDDCLTQGIPVRNSLAF